MKVLVVDPDAARASSVVDALAGTEATAAVAPTGSFALTMLEWNRQDVIISRAQVGDMDGHELCALVRTDPSTWYMRFVLVANDVTPAQVAQNRIDLVIPEGLIGHAIVTRVMHLMRRTAEASGSVPAASVAAPAPVTPRPLGPAPIAPALRPIEPVPPAFPTQLISPRAASAAPPPAVPPIAPPPPAAPPVSAAPPGVPTPVPSPPAAPLEPATTAAPKRFAPPSPPLTELEAVGLNGATRTFQGALGALRLEDLAQAIAGGSKTGRLLLVLGTGGGMIAFDGGRVVHAEIGNTTGETAFQSLVAAAHREGGGKFCFIPSAPRDLANVPKTITRSVADLFNAAGRTMDEER